MYQSLQGLIAYALGTFLTESGSASFARHLQIIFAFAAITPIGILLGMLLAQSNGEVQSPLASACVATTAGSFLYVSIMELLSSELHKRGSTLLKLCSLMGGFSLAVLLGVIAG